ncbi:uncharacterized protein LOC128208772 isoform X1 [Mya arenaria]|uniref:uncharacterized protein LOC128208772 isoform X1 n=2 Tax=Mya arenaria TaxID=6604 RepID=UPI0022E2F211|nr:uncharacterized protein LOC128208772 isoform X1 [Mya arenaria]XP_052768319.1 uncharacterized protein LOC128208772 isoform X1 [Mya arenaria]XP_052768320.1 uncharacterized protein LOC128208772 isoform X1 [Mya arenaria]
MPVSSKPLRGKRPPPILAPKPFNNTRKLAWRSVDASPTQDVITIGVEEEQTLAPSLPPRPRQSILRQKSSDSSNGQQKPPPTVKFSEDFQDFENPPPRPTALSKRRGGDSDDACFSNGPIGAMAGADENVGARRKPPRPATMSNAQALRECEEHTDWANEVLTRHNLPIISDLRTSIGDGYTLPTILEIISGVSLRCVETSPQTKEARVRNIRNCLKFVCKRGVDITDIQPDEIEDGHLKTVLLLIGNIRKHFQNGYKPECNGFTSPVEESGASVMPGAVRLPGAVPTPFMGGQHTGHGGGEPLSRSGYHDNNDLLLGTMRLEPNGDGNNNNKPHNNIISTTEIGVNGVAQHGVDERRTHLGAGGYRGGVIRHPNARPLTQPTQESPGAPPTSAHRAWTGSPLNNAQNNNGVMTSPTVEERLRQLIGSKQSGGSKGNGGYPGGGGFFHGGGSEVFDSDGEMLVVPPPTSRKSPDFDSVMYSQYNYGPGYRAVTDSSQGPQQGYVPSKPSEKREGSRADIIRYRPPSAVAFRQHAPAAQIASSVPRARPSSATGSLMTNMYNGGENTEFNQENGPNSVPMGNRASDVRPTGNNTPGKGLSGGRANSSDLRNAWNRLYGGSQPPPYVSPAMRRATTQQQVRSQSPASRPVSAPAPAHMQAHYQQEVKGQGNSPQTGFQPEVSRGHSNNLLTGLPHEVKGHSNNTPSGLHNDIRGHGNFPQTGFQPNGNKGHINSQTGFHSELRGHSNGQTGFQPEVRVQVDPRAQSTSQHRESPMGQSSSTQGHLNESSSSQQSRLSEEITNHDPQGHGGMDGNLRKSSESSHQSFGQASPGSPGSPNYAIGPASKYPEYHSSRPLSARKPPALPSRSPQRPDKLVLTQRNNLHSELGGKNDRRTANRSFAEYGDRAPSPSVHRSNKHTKDLTTALQAASKEHRHNLDLSRDFSHNKSHDLSQEMQTCSIFDYNVPSRSESTGSITPPLPPLSPANSDSPTEEFPSNLARSTSASNLRMPDQHAVESQLRDGRKPRRTSELNFRMERKSHGKKQKKNLKSKGANLVDVRESDSESNLSFDIDIDNTILTVESHDTEQLNPAGMGAGLPQTRDTPLRHPAGDILTTRESSSLQHQMHSLENRYLDLQTRVQGGHPGHGPPAIGRQRRWSIGSSDTSSFRREARFKPGKQLHHKHQSREFKNINKRFQRLESHVVTLARSVAHLSSELRTHNTVVTDLEGIKRQLADLSQPSKGQGHTGTVNARTDREIFREWAPGLTNPKRVNKLTKFFGSEPPLLELFLKQLGYERYAINFHSEHIGMIELPYMTEDRLEKIGVPMGPRMRILQEAKQCFRDDNMDVYIV